MARHALLIPLLLILTATDHVICQNTIDLGSQQLRSCTFPLQRSLQDHDVGTNFRARCSPECMHSSITSQEAGKQTVFGTRVYDLSSDLCLAAVHDARLPRPSRLTSSATVLLTLVRYDRPFVASFRRGVSSGGRPYQQHQQGLQFVSDRVNEAVPDITTVHTNFRRTSGKTYVKCHFGSSSILPEVQIYNVSRGTAHALKARDDNQSAVVSSPRDEKSLPEAFLCRLDTSAYSDVTTIAYSGNAFYEPGRKTYRVNAGEYVQMTSSSKEARDPTWFGAGFGGLPRQGTGNTSKHLIIPNATEEDTGVYLLASGPHHRPASSATRLIVRACPANFFGTKCDKRCPHCLHGGQCHEVTGQCVCPPGFIGSQCETGCGKDRFGASCSSECPTGNCRGRLLCAPDPYGCSCAPGWSGNSCNQRCRHGKYGPDCAFTCGRCAESSCNRFTGYCVSDCLRKDVRTPLCQENQWPWFRDPPEVAETDLTRVVVRHRRWRRQYDNGYSNGTLQYIGQIKPADGSERWSTPENSTVILEDSLGGNKDFKVAFDNLKVDTKYLVRIVIKDLSLKAQQDSDELIQVAHASTDCAPPGPPRDLKLTNRSQTTLNISWLEPEKKNGRLDGFRLNVSLAEPGSGWRRREAASFRSLDIAVRQWDGQQLNDDKPYSQLVDGLLPGHRYLVQVAANTSACFGNPTSDFMHTLVAPPITPSLLTPVLVVLLFLLLIVAAVGATLYRKRSKKEVLRNGAQHPAADVPLNALLANEREDREDVIENEDMEDEEAIYENIQPDQINYSRIELKDLAERTRAGIMSGELKAQLQNLPHGLKRSCTFGELAENRPKNRYVDLLPYDESRVVLDKMPGDDLSDYINANYIEGYNRPRAYIACQGPNSETVFDFWRMVWQEKVTRIVMLTNLVESGKRKCDQYWPDSEPLHLPGLTRLSDTEHVFSDYTVRKLCIRKGSETRAVTHFQYTVWPDHSVPMHPSSLAKFIKAVNDVDDGAAPTVVHCSAGVGRTGTVILIDTMYQMGLREQAVDVFSHLAIIRQQRANLCANLPQYKLVHQVLVELLVSPPSAVPAAQVARRLPQLRAPGASGPSQLELQLRYLNEHRPPANYASVYGLQLDGKNRSPEVLPEDASRVFLDPTMPDNYINAVYVQGYKVQDAFIATEAPLPARKYMFWQMVVQKHSRVIVVMNDLEEEDIFWPIKGQADVYRDLEVQRKSESVSDDIIIISLKITHFDSNQVKGTLDVSVLVLANADKGDGGDGADGGEGGDERPSCLPTAPALLRLYSAYMRSAAPLGDLPTVVVCRSGVSGCGLFVTVCFELEHLSEEQELDVMMAVSTVRRSRPRFITGMDQFELCYDMAVSWLEAFATYANFQ